MSTFKQDIETLSASLSVSYNTQKVKKLLRILRSNRIRRSDLVVTYGVQLLKNSLSSSSSNSTTPSSSSSLGTEVYAILEQVFFACLDMHKLDDAALFLNKHLKKDFPNSIKLKGYEGMLLESQKRYDEAIKKYDEILVEDDCNAFAMKRKVCVYKEKRDISKAISVMNNDYLKTYMGDAEGWQELSDMYLSLNMYKQAAFCYEELLLTTPHNPHFVLSYASILYTMGGFDNLIMSRKYFCFAYELNNDDVRALLGLGQVCVSLSYLQKVITNVKLKEENSKLYSLALKKLVLKKLTLASLNISTSTTTTTTATTTTSSSSSIVD